MSRRFVLVLTLGLLALPSAGRARTAKASAQAPAMSSAEPIALHVDLRDVAQKIFHVEESVPVEPGPLTLDYPKWIPGEHSPSGPVVDVAGLRITAGGTAVAWRRDLDDMYVLHLEVPKGVHTLGVAFDFLSPTGGGRFGQSVSVTENLVALEWNQVVFYPAGRPSREIRLQPTVELPEGWRYATALDTASSSGSEVRFEATSLAELVDSPLVAGVNFREVELAGPPARPVVLDLVADAPADLEITDEETKDFRALVEQAKLLFGAEHYDHYRFLLILSDESGHFGLEHHRSSDDRTWAEFLTDPVSFLSSAGLLPHEYVHSWNGKFRRPADLWTPDFNRVPMRDDLLWVYEGLTTYWGDVLTARSGLRSAAQYRDALAASAAAMDHRTGRAWRPLQDTADEAQILYYSPGGWRSWRRGTDFYGEGELIWLDVDTKIRELSGDRKSLDDFARRFYGMDDGSWTTKTYTFDDLVAALREVQPFDWASFLRERLDATGEHAPLDGIEHGGYRLVYTGQPSGYETANETRRHRVDLEDSLGLVVSTGHDSSGGISDVLWQGPAFRAGLAPGMKLVAVDGRAFTADGLKAAVEAAASDKPEAEPIELLVKDQDVYKTVRIDYHGGLRYPHLERREGAPALLDEIVAPRK